MIEYLKRKIEQSIVKKYKKLLDDRKDGKYFFQELTEEYKKIKEDEKEKFLQVVFKVIFNTNFNIGVFSIIAPSIWRIFYFSS